MKNLLFKPVLLLLVIFSFTASAQPAKFFNTQGKDITGPDGKPFLIKGTNLGNWLVPEGYMFKLPG
jgi:endoglucanase